MNITVCYSFVPYFGTIPVGSEECIISITFETRLKNSNIHKPNLFRNKTQEVKPNYQIP
jgi:hypothetical protein